MQDQAQINYAWFRDALPGLLATHRGQHALIHEQAVVAYFRTSLEAIKEGYTLFGEGSFSVEEVTDSVEDLGFYSHVGSALLA